VVLKNDFLVFKTDGWNEYIGIRIHIISDKFNVFKKVFNACAERYSAHEINLFSVYDFVAFSFKSKFPSDFIYRMERHEVGKMKYTICEWIGVCFV